MSFASLATNKAELKEITSTGVICNIKHVRLNDLQLDDEHAYTISNALKKNKIVDIIVLNNNPFLTIKGIESIFEALSGKNLSGIHLNSCRIGDDNFFKLTKHNCWRQLTHIDLVRTGMKDKAAQAIAKVLRDTSVRWLNLNDNAIGENGIGAISGSLMKKPIEEFHIARNPIGEKGHMYLARAILTWPCLKRLDVQSTNMSSEGGKFIAEALLGKTMLIDVYLGGNEKNIKKNRQAHTEFIGLLSK